MKRLNKKSLSKSMRILAVCLVTVLLATLSVPVVTRAAGLKEEVVYVRLNNDGSLGEVYVVNSFTLDKGGQIVDYGNYSYVQNLSNMDTLRLKDGVVKVDTKADKLYYEGYLEDAQLPWEFSITYTLNGKPIKAEQLGGRDGRFEMTLAVKYNPLGSREFFDRYVLQISVSLDAMICRNLDAHGGTVANAGGDKLTTYMVMPGNEAELVLLADVTNFTMPAITIAGVTMSMDLGMDDVDMSEMRQLIDGLAQLDDGVQELLDGIFELHGGSVEFADGMEQYADGVGQMSDGVGELEDGVKEFSDGLRKFDDGLKEFRRGTMKLVQGTKELYDGHGQLTDGIVELNSHSGELYGGFEMYYEQAIFGLVNGMFSMFGADLGIDRSNFHEILFYDGEDLTLPFDENNPFHPSNIDPENIPPLDPDAVAAIMKMIMNSYKAQIDEGLTDEMQDTIKQTLYDNIPFIPPGSLDGIDFSAIADTMMGGIMDNMDFITNMVGGDLGAQLAGMRFMLDNYEFMLLAGLADYMDGIDQLTGGTVEFHAGLLEYYKGIVELDNGVRKIKDGSGKIYKGSIDLYKGVVELHDGTIELFDGAVQLRDGSFELSDGIGQLYDGVAELKDGTGEIRENTSTLDTDIVDGITSAITEMMGGEGPIYSFVSLENGEVEAVQFVIQTGGISRPEPTKAADAGETKTTFWQRFLALFGVEA